MNRALKITLTVVAALVITAAAILAAAFGIGSSGKSKLSSDGSKPNLPDGEETRETESGAEAAEAETDETKAARDQAFYSADVFHNSKAYNYRENLINILFIGVDKTSDKDGIAQADALYLVVFDPESKKADVIAISRCTYAQIDMKDAGSSIAVKGKLQICLAYGYGNDDAEGSALTADAVSKLFYGVPIQGYYTIFMDEIPEIVYSVGGVEVSIGEDMTDCSPDMKAGARVILTGENALKYLRWRENTNSARVKNQLEFIKSFAAKVKGLVSGNPAEILTLYSSLSSVSATNLSYDSVLYLISEAAGAEIGEIVNLEGESGILNGSEVMYLDDAALYDFILEHFYTEVK